LENAIYFTNVDKNWIDVKDKIEEFRKQIKQID
jgi:hypothetical protein